VYFNGKAFFPLLAAMVALVLATFVLWIGGAFLGECQCAVQTCEVSISPVLLYCFIGFTVGPAQNNNAQGQCGVHLTVPLINKDAYIWYLSVCTILNGLAKWNKTM